MKVSGIKWEKIEKEKEDSRGKGGTVIEEGVSWIIEVINCSAGIWMFSVEPRDPLTIWYNGHRFIFKHGQGLSKLP